MLGKCSSVSRRYFYEQEHWIEVHNLSFPVCAMEVLVDFLCPSSFWRTSNLFQNSKTMLFDIYNLYLSYIINAQVNLFGRFKVLFLFVFLAVLLKMISFELELHDIVRIKFVWHLVHMLWDYNLNVLTFLHVYLWGSNQNNCILWCVIFVIFYAYAFFLTYCFVLWYYYSQN